MPAFSGKDRVECAYSILSGTRTPDIFLKLPEKFRISEAILIPGCEFPITLISSCLMLFKSTHVKTHMRKLAYLLVH